LRHWTKLSYAKTKNVILWYAAIDLCQHESAVLEISQKVSKDDIDVESKNIVKCYRLSFEEQNFGIMY